MFNSYTHQNKNWFAEPSLPSTMLTNFDMLSLQPEARPSSGGGPERDVPGKGWYENASGQRATTDVFMAATIREAHPGLAVTAAPYYSADLLQYAAATGLATATPIVDPADPLSSPYTWKMYLPGNSRVGEEGRLLDSLKYGKFSYSYQGFDYVLYVADCRDGYSSFLNQYLVHGGDIESQSKANYLLREVGKWSNELHGEIWVFDQGYWSKSAELFQSIAKSRWEDVILAEHEKTSLRGDVKRFFDAKDRYEKYRIAWKRGVIYYGPPGNGKTISVKALSNELYHRKEPIPALYVKTLTSYGGPEYSVKLIFAKARAEAPCLLVFEDLDSLITEQVRSYFLNEVDGLNTNQGVYMIGSTNYIDKLDPGLSKRPSRFDRKFLFGKPTESERVQYCEYWRHKLKGSKESKDDSEDDLEDDLVHVDAEEIDFPPELSPEIARITDGFSFAYLQEAFVASLLAIASMDDEADAAGGDTKKDKFEHLLFWRVIKHQIELLREQIDDENSLTG